MLGLLVLFSSFSVADTPMDHDNSMGDINPADQLPGSYCLWALAAASLAGFAGVLHFW